MKKQETTTFPEGTRIIVMYPLNKEKSHHFKMSDGLCTKELCKQYVNSCTSCMLSRHGDAQEVAFRAVQTRFATEQKAARSGIFLPTGIKKGEA